MNLPHLLARCLQLICAVVLAGLSFATAADAEKLTLPQGAAAAIDKIYSFDTAAAIDETRHLQEQQPEHPLGYLLEAEALWWKMWCTSAEYKWGMTNAWHRPKLAADQRYQELTTKASLVAIARIKEHDTAEMQFYAGLADAFAARFYGLRAENRATARAGVRAREHFLRAMQLDPDFTDAEFGLGLYNYYVDTLSGIAKVLRFFMGIPGGNKQEGIRQLEHAMADGVLTPAAARFYLVLNLHRYDQQYEKALRIIGPLTEKYPSNPLFQLAQGDLYGKLGRKEQALRCYRAAEAINIQDPECRDRVQGVARAAMAAQQSTEGARTQ
jgi:tetratricopeptide (TPR) repeat protein